MLLSHLQAHNFRNFSKLNIDFHPRGNLFCGDNGSGKTSILEAIYYCSAARSFRSHIISRVVQHGCDAFSIFATLTHDDIQHSFGLERFIDNPQNNKLQLDSKLLTAVVELARFFPLQLVSQKSFDLLTTGPAAKRKFIDWGMFHVEHNFFDVWRQAKRALDQRNAALKDGCEPDNKALESWSRLLAEWGTKLDAMRQTYIASLLPAINILFRDLLGNYQITLDYYSGWNTKFSLFEALQSSFERDRLLKSTQVGHHRADLRLLIDNVPVQDVLSRGQQKIFIFLLYLAQGVLLKNLTTKTCAYLIDDLAAELDEDNQENITKILSATNAQLFVTGLSPHHLAYLKSSIPHQMFHVKHGELMP